MLVLFFQWRHLMLSLFVFKLLHLSNHFLQAFGHEIWPLRGSIISLEVFKEAQKQGINCHDVNTEKGACYEISANDNDSDGRE